VVERRTRGGLEEEEGDGAEVEKGKQNGRVR
jgi:hypothetical protein